MDSVAPQEGIASEETAAYPIPAIYLHLVAVMNYMSLKSVEKARDHLLAAWELARPDDLIEAFGEHHGLLGGMLESVVKPEWPEDFKRIIDITYRFSAGWRRVHNSTTGDEVADDLTTTEFATAMLAARGWTNQEIADHLGVSINTVKRHLAHAMEKLAWQAARTSAVTCFSNRATAAPWARCQISAGGRSPPCSRPRARPQTSGEADRRDRGARRRRRDGRRSNRARSRGCGLRRPCECVHTDAPPYANQNKGADCITCAMPDPKQKRRVEAPRASVR